MPPAELESAQKVYKTSILPIKLRRQIYISELYSIILYIILNPEIFVNMLKFF